MTRPTTLGFQKPVHTTERKDVRIATITSTENVTGCSCGWVKAHPRLKVREDAAERHLTKAHGGIGVWL